MLFGVEEVTSGPVTISLQPGDNAASPEGSGGLVHEWDSAVDNGAGSKGVGGCGVGSFDDNDRTSVVWTFVTKTASALISVCSGRPGFK